MTPSLNTTFENCTLLDTHSWFGKARPDVTEQDRQSQLGVHMEEVVEMLDCLTVCKAAVPALMNARRALNELANLVKSGQAKAKVLNKEDFLDSLCDQVVTATGVAYCHHYDFVGAMTAVNRSNFSKFDDQGNPIRNEHGKIMKGPNYHKVDLSPYVPQ